MLISLDILKKFVDIDGINPQEISDKLTEHTIEVDDVVNEGDAFKNIVVGRIEKVEIHPNADKLRVCDVLISKKGGLFNKKEEIVQIVCGGSNLEKGMHVVVALPGSFVKWHGEGELVEIKETELRSVKSFGMICASDEIGLSDIFPSKEEKEIIDLDSFKSILKNDIKVGENIADLLSKNNVYLDVDNIAITHRPDLWGHYGVAREIAAIYKKDLKELEIDELQNTSFTQLKIEVDNPELCRAYNAVKINNIKIEESPEWLKTSILNAGLRPINNIVDLTNYVMIETAQPMHAFDSSKISNKIFVRLAKNNEKIKTLDGKDVDLDENTLIISDSIKPIAIAGVIGGMESSVSSSTNSIVLESANFDGVSIRKTMQKIGVRTDAGARFEKQIDSQFTKLALARFVHLLKKINPKIVVENIQSFDNFDKNQKEINLSLEFIQNRIGVNLSSLEIISILQRLKFEVDFENDSFNVKIPYFRNKDINIKEDLIEEIARIYGYNNIKEEVLTPNSIRTLENGLRKFERRVKEFMIDNGFSEVLNYSFVSEKDVNDFGINDNSVVKLQNSLTVEQDRLKPNLIINIIKNIKNNLKYGDRFKIFEIERAFVADKESSKFEGLPSQDYHFAACFVDSENEKPLYSIKDYLEKLFSLFKIDFEYGVNDEEIPDFCHKSRFAKVFANGICIGFISELSPSLSLDYKIKSRISFFELNFEKLYESLNENVKYEYISKFQDSSLDVSMIINKKILWQDIKKSILDVSDLIKSIDLFDVYSGENISTDKISLAFRFIISNKEKTMTQEEIDNVYKQVIDVLKNKFGAEIRE